MAFCQNCGAPVEGKFCAKCGASQAAGAPPPVPPSGAGASGLSDNAAGALCYIPLIGVIFLLIEPYNRNKLIRFHAFQSLFLLGALIVFNIVVTSVAALLWGFWTLWILMRLAFFALWVYLVVKTFQGEKVVLPVIGPMAQNQA